MKKITLLLIASAGCICSISQPVKLMLNGAEINLQDEKMDTIRWQEPKDDRGGRHALIMVNSRNQKLPIMIETKNIGTNDDDYTLLSTKNFNLEMPGYQFPIEIQIKSDVRDEKRESFYFIFSYPEWNDFGRDTLVVEISDAGEENDKDKKEDKKSEKKNPAQIMYLNAYNFDFGNTSLQSNYVGHLNIFHPGPEKKWGFNTGIMKINYSQDDSSINERQIIENVLIDPFDEVIVNSKYLKQLNSYKTQRKNTVWSLYVQPLYRLNKSVFIHGHLELLPTKWSSKTTINNTDEDTAIVTQVPVTFPIKTILSKTSSYTINGVYGYFGAGLTFNLDLWDNGSFFFQPTIGTTSNYPQPASIDINSTTFPYTPKSVHAKWSSFYLVRAYFTQNLTDKSTIVIGTDIRGLFPLYSPLYAVYAGLNLSLDKVLEIIKGK